MKPYNYQAVWSDYSELVLQIKEMTSLILMVH